MDSVPPEPNEQAEDAADDGSTASDVHSVETEAPSALADTVREATSLDPPASESSPKLPADGSASGERRGAAIVRKRSIVATLFVLGAVGGLYRALSHPDEHAQRTADQAGMDAGVDANESSDAAFAADVAFVPTFRVSALSANPEMEQIDGTLGKRTLLVALSKSGVSVGEGTRLLRAFEGVHRFDRAHPKDSFIIVRDRTSHRIVGFEYEVSPLEIYQAREVDGHLVAKKLDLLVSKKRVAAGVLVGSDLRESLKSAGFESDMAKRLDDALDGHLATSDIHKGGRLKIVAVETKVENAFARYERVEAVEYQGSRKQDHALRVYGFGEGRHVSYYDARRQRPFHGGWRLPIPMARITSRFNPKRMHPVLHRVMPHNGVDFAGSTGTPVYAVASGTLKFAADSGPCGNMVTILHPGGLSTAYCHLSKFAPGLEVGERIEGRQLIGYVGQTGRVTGPHLHFAVKRGSQFVDPATLKMGEVTRLPSQDREAFDTARAELDAALDRIEVAGQAPEIDSDAGEPSDENLDVYEEN